MLTSTIDACNSPVLVDDGTECQSISPASVEVLHIHTWVAVLEGGKQGRRVRRRERKRGEGMCCVNMISYREKNRLSKAKEDHSTYTQL